MAGEYQLELYRAAREAQEKYTYFLLAAAGAAIAFAITQTQAATLTWSKLPLGVSVLCWGLSFFFGCQHVTLSRQVLYANFQYSKVERGEHPELPPHPDFLAFARSDLEQRAVKPGRAAARQFSFLLAGAAFYIAWHMWEMYLRTPGHG